MCIDHCPMDAIELDDTMRITRDRCIGCGVCIGACPVDIIELRQKEEQDQYVPPKDIVEMHKIIAKEGGNLKKILQKGKCIE